MPIRFSGSARPRKLKSPDPINMPSVRENIVPRIKAEVAYFKENGSLPSVTGPWSSATTYFALSSSSTEDPIVGFDVYNDDIIVINNRETSSAESYKRNSSTGEWEYVNSKYFANIAGGDILINADDSKVFIGVADASTSTGTVVECAIDLTTGVMSETHTSRPSSVSQNFIYDGARIVDVGNGLIVSSAPGYTANSVRAGLLLFRDRVTGTVGNIARNFQNGNTNPGYGTNSSNHQLGLGNRDYFWGASTIVDDGRMIVASSPVYDGAALLNNSFATVFTWDGTTLADIQQIQAPGNGERMVAVFNSDTPGNFYMVLGNGDYTRDLVEYSWNGSSYDQISRAQWGLTFEMVNRDGLIRTRTMPDGSLLIPAADSSGEIKRITRN